MDDTSFKVLATVRKGDETRGWVLFCFRVGEIIYTDLPNFLLTFRKICVIAYNINKLERISKH